MEELVRFYVQREFQIARGTILHPVPARPAPMTVFEFGDPVNVVLIDEGICIKAPVAVVVGLQTYRRVEMQLQGRPAEFAIMFQPDGLQRLYSIPSKELPEKGGDAHAVIGTCMSRLWQTLGELSSFDERVRVVDDFFSRRSLRSIAANEISKVVGHIVRQRGCIGIRTLSEGTGLSSRHFSRRFVDHMGMCPKLFARVVRFQAALEGKALDPRKTWTDVAHQFGYFDQMHLIHDFERLAGARPKELLLHLETVFVDQIRRIRSNPLEATTVGDARLTL